MRPIYPQSRYWTQCAARSPHEWLQHMLDSIGPEEDDKSPLFQEAIEDSGLSRSGSIGYHLYNSTLPGLRGLTSTRLYSLGKWTRVTLVLTKC